jgi:hypothetical protein
MELLEKYGLALLQLLAYSDNEFIIIGDKKLNIHDELKEVKRLKQEVEYNPLKDVRGFTSWQNTHFEIVDLIVHHRDGEMTGEVKQSHASQGTAGLWDLAVQWTNEFEEKYKNENWEELDYYEEVEKFCKLKNEE